MAAASEIPPGKYPDFDAVDIYRLVISDFLRKHPIKPSDVDGVLAAPAGMGAGLPPDIFIHEKIIEELGITPRFSATVNAGGASYSVMVRQAEAAIAAGVAESVLCVGAGKFARFDGGGAEALAKLVTEPDFEYIYGPYIPAIYALAASRYLAEYNLSDEALAWVAVSARKWALLNPDAQAYGAGPLSVDDVLASRPIASPLRFLDCSRPCEGGAAVLVTTPEKARSFSPQPAYILGTGAHHNHSAISQARDLLRTGAGEAGRQAFSQAGLGPDDIDVVELYDAFTINPLMNLEELGFCPLGGSAEFIMKGNTDPGGALPMNTNGGLLSFGHTGDASGMSVLVEGARQTMGTAGPNQVDCGRVLVHCYGGMMGEHVVIILGRDA